MHRQAGTGSKAKILSLVATWVSHGQSRQKTGGLNHQISLATKTWDVLLMVSSVHGWKTRSAALLTPFQVRQTRSVAVLTPFQVRQTRSSALLTSFQVRQAMLTALLSPFQVRQIRLEDISDSPGSKSIIFYSKVITA